MLTAERCLHILHVVAAVVVVVVVVVVVDLQAAAVAPSVRRHLHHHRVVSAFRVASEEIGHPKQISRNVSMIVSST